MRRLLRAAAAGATRTRGAATLAAALLLAGPAWAAPLTGDARVVDGDTLRLSLPGGAEEKIRVLDIDAPEAGQNCRDAKGRSWRCGEAATAMAARLAALGPMRCEGEGRDKYGRLLAACAAADGRDLGGALVGAGLALAYRRFSDRYVPQEIDAFKAGRGMWAGAFDKPWDWRHGRRSAASAGDLAGDKAQGLFGAPEAPVAAASAPAGCAIKGNISGNGQIYHMPGQADYDRTRISAKRGERWFCSEEEARAAGWRRAKR
ncbi:thermonuclease family protein [Rhodovulum sp. DZ06]|uniref:thermonuclease family protein n=1 Tax=Rhodovulum sp. DZ06 TaxID=3425126 RepID=UPI003D32FA8C